MSATKRDSIDGIGTPEDEFWQGYEEWSDSLVEATGDPEGLVFSDDREHVPCEGKT